MDASKRKQENERLYEEKLMETMFPITSVSRADLLNKEVGFTRKQALQVSDEQMRKIASKLADDYCNQLFWSSLSIIAESETDEK